MWPYSFGIKTYSVIYILGMVVHAGLAIVRAQRRGVGVRFGLFLAIAYPLGMVVGAKLLYDLLGGQFALLSYFKYSTYAAGGLWGGPLAYLAIAVPIAILLRGDRAARLDLIALCLPPAMILAKLACLVNGCCYGAACDRPWAVAFPEGADAPAGIYRHPTQIYEMLVLLVILLVVHALDRPRWRGTLLLWFVALYGLGRPLTELFRGDADSARSSMLPLLGPFSASQLVCMVAAAVAGAALIKFRCARGRDVQLELHA